ncbi:dihydroxyacetone kinase family protein [Nocardioides sp. CFH 31398]|uniref:dihydroxyacetone kinase family protein n=1 Tax=Nocardioides sp. CFH 31398 TaxID=2919579 RepID=UPI001F06D7F0|nr:dihydroxyacetone kinase family protein [Nocardioides sp. CFH 31398]MCH1866631.1 dihydroxyacetone kinase subunit DhaK [Nocardioides sp. CFH 31398]
MKKLLNDVADVVPEMLEGLVAGAPGLVLLDGQTVVLRRDHAELGKVALVSGGGAGHEPAHGGYVGPGMLTGAVVGDMFTSPSTDAVLAAVRAIAAGEQQQSAGVLLIVKNYTGDRLNFGLAAELARAEGTAVDMVVIGDDVALAADGDHAGRRGIAGTVLVHKAAGAAADRGDDLAAVTAVAQRVADDVRSMGVSLGACTVPAVGEPGFTLEDDEVEWGLGIHGEAGVERGPLVSADETTARLVDAVADDADLVEGQRVVLLVNDLGTTPPSELDVVARGALARLRDRGLVVERMWVGRFLTALDMPGVSVSVLPVDDELLGLLDHPTETAAWPAPHQGMVAEARAVPAPAEEEPATGEHLAEDSPVRRALVAACESLKAAEPELTRLDSEVGDGDLGTGLERGATAVLSEIDRYAADPVGALRDTSATLRRAIGGTSGPLYSILLMRAAASLEESGSTDAQAWAAALQAGVDGIGEVGGASVGDRTMLDALVPLATSFAQHLDAGDSPASAWRDAVDAAARGTEETAQSSARVGRSSYLGDRVKGTPDPGARAVVVWSGAVGEELGS